MIPALAEELAEMSDALDERLASQRAVDLARAVSRKGISAEEVAEIVHRFEAAREDDAPVAVGVLQ